MKQLIFLLLASSVFAQVKNEMPDDDVSKQFVADVKDSEIDVMLKKTKEFSDCYEKNKFDQSEAGDDDKQKTKIDAASLCFKQKLTGKGDKALLELSKQLDLENLGIVKSKNVNDVTEYLTDKMYKAMTGYSRHEKDQKKLIESMKFSNKKMIDQSVFINLYKTQLTKSILQEISSYCFNDFRQSTTSSSKTDTFENHWGAIPTNSPLTGTFNDLGEPKFDIDMNQFDINDPTKNYQGILNSIGGQSLSPAQLSTFVTGCMKQIHKLCKAYSSTGKPSNMPVNGMKSCLVRTNLTNLRKAMADANKVADQFKAMDGKGVALMLDRGQQANFYDPNDKRNSLDELTTRTSKDILEGGSDKQLMELADKCKKTPTEPECERFYREKDGYDKAEYDKQMELTLRRDVEVARVAELKKDPQKLEDYLKENGYLDLLEKYKTNPTGTDIETLIGEEFNKRREAAIAEMRKKVGSRQAKADDVKKDKTEKDRNIVKNADETLSERVRLAQVVMFNNIILGSVDFKDDKGKSLGSIASGLKRETAEQESNVKGTFFDGLKQTVDSSKTTIDNETLDGSQIVDLIFKP